MRIEQLAYLIEISKSPSINIASEKLHISHQCLNKAIKSLEQELDASLLIRTTTGVTLTPVGQKTVQIAKIILDQINELKNFISDGQEPTNNQTVLKGNLTVVGTPLSASTILTPVLNDFKKQYPKVKVSISEVMPDKVLELINSGEYDFGIVNLDQFPFEENAFQNIAHHQLYQEKTMALMHKHSPLSHYKSISISSLLKHPVIVYGSHINQGNFIAELLRRYGSLANCTYTNNLQFYYETLLSATASAVTTASVYHSITADIKSQLVLLPIKDNLKTYVTLIHRQIPPLTPIASAAVNSIKDLYIKV